ncbi:MAG: YaaC family protein [Candidatus Nealsonbacteria bacterium]
MKELYANTIEEGVWRYIDLFSRYEFLKKTCNDKEKAKHISFCLKQAKEYYESAKISSFLTKPLMLYYGMLNLVKALILLKDPTIKIDSHLKKHGIGNGKKTIDSLFSLSCIIGKKKYSIFPRLLEIARYDRCKVSVSIDGTGAAIEEKADYIHQKNFLGRNYKVSELIVLLPELFDLVLEETKLLTRSVPLLNFKYNIRNDKQNRKLFYSGGRISFQHNRYKKVKDIIKRHEKKVYLRMWSFEEDKWDVVTYKMEKEVEKLIHPNIRETIFRKNYMLLPDFKKFNLSEIAIHFMLIFILGDTARYSPYIWSRLMERRIRESRIIETFLDLTTIKFPLLILRELRDELIYFKQI